jgi:hypothetical protein
MSFDNPWQWSETAASNTAIASIDITGATGKVKDGDNALRAMMSQIITMEGKGTGIASAATLTLSGPERYFHITGNTGPITDIDFTDAVDGRWAWLIFDSTPTITHNATTLQLPGAANIVAAAGDRALFVQDSSDNVICLAYIPAAPVPNTLNGQYKFPATQNASADANTLDDYEEGTFTPTLTFGGAATGLTYSSRSGTYTKIGRAVFFDLTIALSAKGSSTGTALVESLPFTCGSSSVIAGRGSALVSLTAGIVGLTNSAATTLTVRRPTTTGDAACTEANFDNATVLQLTGSYLV